MKKQLIVLVILLTALLTSAPAVMARSSHKSYRNDHTGTHTQTNSRNYGSNHHYRSRKHCKPTYKQSRRDRRSNSIGIRIGGFGFYLNTGNRPYRGRRRPIYRPQCQQPIVRFIEEGYRLYQPPVRGHIAFLQRWSNYEGRWITINTHPSVY